MKFSCIPLYQHEYFNLNLLKFRLIILNKLLTIWSNCTDPLCIAANRWTSFTLWIQKGTEIITRFGRNIVYNFIHFNANLTN
jgi:hypothetical protein